MLVSTQPSSSRKRKNKPNSESIDSVDGFVARLFETSEYAQSDWYSLPLTDHNARPKQRPPDGDWRIWLIMAGRGFGKTRSIVEWATEQARLMPKSYGLLVGATASDVRDILVEGESGILNCGQEAFRPIYNPSKSLLTWPNGSIARLRSADEPNRFRGLQHHWAICDELAAWRYPESFDQILLGLRLGQDPRVVIATTPRPIPILKRMLEDATCVISSGSTYENVSNLAPAFLTNIVNRYEGTTLGRQELNAEILSDLPGALWKRGELDSHRVSAVPELKRIVVALDPAVTASTESDETGIIVAGIDANGHGYVLEDATLSASPAGWAKQAIATFNKYRADRLIAEVNNGGDMIENTIRTVRDEQDQPIGKNIPFTQVRASRGKVARAEPIAAFYEQGKVHHVGMFALLEDQMCTALAGGDSPDRVDALVWALTELMLGITYDVSPSRWIHA